MVDCSCPVCGKNIESDDDRIFLPNVSDEWGYQGDIEVHPDCADKYLFICLCRMTQKITQSARIFGEIAEDIKEIKEGVKNATQGS